MFINKNSLKVKTGNGIYINLGDYIVQAKYGYYKLWGPNSGRNLAGKQTGVLIGIFPKIIVSFRKLTKSELETLTPILDSKRQTVSYYDPRKKAQVTMATYTGDYEVINKNIIGGKFAHKNEGFDISFIAIERRK